MQTRKVVRIEKSELAEWADLFSLFGTKTHFQRKYRIPRQTLINILAAGQGEERIVKKIRRYCKKEMTPTTV